MPSIYDVYQSNWLKFSDLQGRKVRVTIEKVAPEKVGEDNKLVAMFSGKEKGLVLNKTNAEMIASQYGPDYANWIGEEIILRPDKTNFKGKITDCIRVELPLVQPESEEEPPF